MPKHIAAIHVLKSQLRLSDDDYRALLVNLTGQRSSKDLTQQQQEAVRHHMQQLAVKLGLSKPTRSSRNTFAQSKNAASPRERKVWALWNQLHRDGVVRDYSAIALNHFVKRNTGVDALRFCTEPMLDVVIGALKGMQRRAVAAALAPLAPAREGAGDV